MKCFKCGAELSDDTKFCSYCGVKIEKEVYEYTQPITETNDSNVSQKEPIRESPHSKQSPKAQTGDGIKVKLSGFWNGLDLFCKVITVAIVAVVILLIVSICAKRGLAIFFSVLQLAGIITALLMHKGKIKLEQRLKWLKYLVLVFAILFTALNVMSYSWGQANRPSGTPTQNPTDYQTPGATAAPDVKTTAVSPYSSEDCIGKDYSSVKSDFIVAGFEQIKVEKVEDLLSTDAEKVDTVVSVSIGEETEFTQGQAFAKDDEVVILYHGFAKCSVTLHIDFIPNIIFSKYDVNLLVNGIDKGTLEHGEDEDFVFTLEPGEYTLTFESADSSSVKGEISLTVDCDIDASYKISCYSDEVSVEELYVDRLTELADGEVKLDASASDYNYDNYEEVTAALEAIGFTNIKYEILYDIVFGWTDEGEVDSVSIAGDKDFTRGDVFASDAEIIITYHMSEDNDPSLISMPNGSSSYVGTDYLDVEKALMILGFTQIVMEETTSTNSSYISGEVLSVSIDGNKDFEQNDVFKNDCAVHIEYYKPLIITMTSASSSYVGQIAAAVRQELRGMGFITVKLNEIETSDLNQDGTISAVTINDASFDSGEQFEDNADVVVTCWKVPSKYEKAYVRAMSNYSLYYMFDTDNKTVVFFGTNDTYVDEGTYTGDFSSGVTINWSHGEWTEKFTHKSGSTATMIDGNGFDWEYKVCDVETAQDILDELS